MKLVYIVMGSVYPDNEHDMDEVGATPLKVYLNKQTADEFANRCAEYAGTVPLLPEHWLGVHDNMWVEYNKMYKIWKDKHPAGSKNDMYNSFKVVPMVVEDN